MARYSPLGGLAARIFRTGCLSPAVAQQFSCDSWWGVTLFNTRGEILYHGRKHRLFGKAQRRAIFLRDNGCVFPGCDKGPEWCDVHHLDFWENGGPTDIDNGCLLCRPCHTRVHHGWILAHLPTGWTTTPPDPTVGNEPGPAHLHTRADGPDPLTPIGPTSRGHPNHQPAQRPTACAPN